MDPISILALVSAAIKAGENIYGFVQRFRDHVKANAEMTPEQEAEFDRELDRITSQPWWTPDNPQ